MLVYLLHFTLLIYDQNMLILKYVKSLTSYAEPRVPRHQIISPDPSNHFTRRYPAF